MASRVTPLSARCPRPATYPARHAPSASSGQDLVTAGKMQVLRLRRLFSAKQCLILGWRITRDRPEVVDEMCLIEVSQFQSQFRPVGYFAGIRALDQFVQAISSYYPFRTDADVLVEDALQ